MYKLTKHTSIQRLSDNANIPADQTNTDYQKYLAWLAAGNTPAPAQTPAEIAKELAAEARSKAQSRITEIRLGLVDLLADKLNGTPAEQAAANGAIGLLRAELALNKSKL